MDHLKLRAAEAACDGDHAFIASIKGAEQVKRLAEDERSSLADVAKIVSQDPLLSAAVLKMANSSILNPYVKPVVSVRQAVQRIGLGPVRCLAYALVLRRNASAYDEPRFRGAAQRIWDRAVSIGAWACLLMKRTSKSHHETAMLSALMSALPSMFVLHILSEEGVEGTAHELVEKVRDIEPLTRDCLFQSLAVPAPIREAIMSEAEPVWPTNDLSEVLACARLIVSNEPIENPELATARDSVANDVSRVVAILQ